MIQTYTLIISYSIEGIFYEIPTGINCVLYAFCVYTIAGQKSVSFRLLCFANTVQFLLCTIQTILHTVLYFIWFTVLTGDIQPYLHHPNVYILGSIVIFNISFIIAGFISIWRLFVLYNYEVLACIPAFVIWIAQICTSGISIHICATTPIASATFNPVNMLLWVLITVLNLCVAIPISIRLCIAQKKTHAVLSSSPYKSIAIVLVECGALITACTMTMMILYATSYPYALVNNGIATKVAVASQYLVIARHALLTLHQDRGPSIAIVPPREVSVGRTESTRVDSPRQSVKTKTISFSQSSKSQDDESWRLKDAI